MPLHRICTSFCQCLQPLLVPREWERWNFYRVILFNTGVLFSIVGGVALCQIRGPMIWSVALMLQMGGVQVILAGSPIFWHILYSLTGAKLAKAASHYLVILNSYRVRKEALQTSILSSIGVGAVASLKRSAFLDDLEGTFATQFSQACAQMIAVFVCVLFCIFTLRNIVFMGLYRLARVLRRWHADAFIKPEQRKVPYLSEEAPGECSVCLIPLADDEGKGLLRLHCGHVFHMPCIKSWLRNREACPLCRSSVPNLRFCVHLTQEEITAPSGVKRKNKPSKPKHKPSKPGAPVSSGDSRQSSPALSDASTAVPDDSARSIDDIEFAHSAAQLAHVASKQDGQQAGERSPSSTVQDIDEAAANAEYLDTPRGTFDQIVQWAEEGALRQST